MKRRSFLQLSGMAAAVQAVAVPVAAAGAEKALVRHPFVKRNALRAATSWSLSECSLEDAIILLIQARAEASLMRVALHSQAFCIVVPTELAFHAAKQVAELRRLHDGSRGVPGALPGIEWRIEPSFKDRDEWGVVASDGLCFYSPGA